MNLFSSFRGKDSRPSCRPWSRFSRLLACLLTAVLATGMFGQNTGAPGQARKSDPAAVARDLATYRAAVDRDKDLAKNNNAVAAEQALTALNRTAPDTAAWHFETAQRLVQTVDQLARDAQPASKTGPLLTSALQHLTQADRPGTPATPRANARMLAGFIYERFLADTR